jgi:hypothetical protein
MIRIHCKITGEPPGIMLDNPISAEQPKRMIKAKVLVDNLEAMAEQSTYRMEDGTLYVKAEAIMRSMATASKWIRTIRGNPPWRQIIFGLISIEPQLQLSLGTKDYEMFVRTIPRLDGMRIKKANAVIKNWSTEFDLLYNPEMFAIAPDILKKILTSAGILVGIGAFRPQHTGCYGRFTIVDWEVEEE